MAAFRLLGIPTGSDREVVVRAYRRLARTTHPDVSADPEASERFATLTAAYRLASKISGRDADPAPAVRPGRNTRAAGDGDDLGSDGATPGWGSHAAWPMPTVLGVAPRSWQRPPIIAGPVHVRPPSSGVRRELRDG